MRTFQCACGARVFFENSLCVACNRELGFIAQLGQMSTIEPDNGAFRALIDKQPYRKCANYVEQGVCNWLVPAGDAEPLCQACRLNRVVPNLEDPDNRTRWADVEAAKRRLLYTLNQLGLPATPQSDDNPDGLAFDIKADTPDARVLTGHADGLITLNFAEADPVLREKMRVEMDERYRTLLGHFRHESGHYYWDRLIRDSHWLQPCRQLFGDETQDYAAALKAHYESKSASWGDEFVSSYASSHPWEDWAETWAHYLHIIDALETGRQFGLLSGLSQAEPSDAFKPMMDAWLEFTIALNAVNRSMGLPDPYPFQLTPKVIEKLSFVHDVLAETRGARPQPKKRKGGLFKSLRPS